MSAAMTNQRRALLISAVCVYVAAVALVDWLTPLVVRCVGAVSAGHHRAGVV